MTLTTLTWEASYMPDVVRRKVQFRIAEWERPLAKRYKLQPDAAGYVTVEVATCPGCGRFAEWYEPDKVEHHDALCTERLKAEVGVAQSPDQVRALVLDALFTRAGKLLGVSNEAAHEALRKLYAWVPERGYPPALITRARKDGFLDANETLDDVPFLSEASVYVLLGKEDGRTLLALVRAVAKAVGFEEGR